MDTLEIKDEEVNVEQIMEKIRENIDKRKKEGIYKENEPEIMSEMFSAASPIKRDIPEGLEFINCCDIFNESYTISSHRPITGKFLVKGRKMVHGEVRRYVDPVFQKQREFNFGVADVVKDLKTESQYLKADVENLNTDLERLNTDAEYLKNDVESLKTDTGHLKTGVEYLKTDFESFKTNSVQNIKSEVNNFISTIDLDLNNKSWLNGVLENRLNENLQNHKLQKPEDKVQKPEDNEPEINYYAFEEHFRGSRDHIQQHQKVFLDYFKDCKNVLDIGCGRGEFLELARQNDIVAKGIDIDEDMVSFCESKGFNVELKDAIETLETIEDKSLDGIFISQVVEHLAPDYLIRMLNLCNKKLKYGFYLIVETVNPLSLFSFANFYIDLTHIKPVHPETLKFLLSAVNFREIEAKFISPVPDSMRLKKLSDVGDLTDREKVMFETYNQNIDMLNNTLYGAQDYAVIGKK
ncbi:MAG TPA: methionine biosynthesis protein MetW [Methanosarcina sp.]